jgi:hypothetical protein
MANKKIVKPEVKKIVKSTSERREAAKLINRYPDLFFLREQPMPEIIIERVIEEIVDFADRETTLRPSQFWNEKKIDPAYYDQWKDKYPNVIRAVAYLKSMCAQRRDIGAVTKELDGNYIKDQQALYDPEYKALIEWRMNLTKKEDEKPTTVIVELGSFKKVDNE